MIIAEIIQGVLHTAEEKYAYRHMSLWGKKNLMRKVDEWLRKPTISKMNRDNENIEYSNQPRRKKPIDSN